MARAARIIFAIVQIVIFSIPAYLQTPTTPKPGLTEKDLEKYTYYFDIVDNKFVGDGANFLNEEIARNQFVILGEYHGSKRISEFTRALIPVFDAAGARHFALEVGPVSSQILTELSRDPAKTVDTLNLFNIKYSVKLPSREFTAIPFFSYVEDAEFLAEAAKRKWSFSGIDQEFSFAYLPLIDRMYSNLSPKKRAEINPLYLRVVELVKTYYDLGGKREKNQYIEIAGSSEINRFLAEASDKNPKNAQIADAIRVTTEIYKNNADTIRKYYDANEKRVAYMKKNLAAAFARNRFDFKKDKMLLKMGAVHTGRGFSPLSLFEIGNTLSELAASNGNSSLHAEFGSRYAVENGKEIDFLADSKSFSYRYHGLLQMAKKDQWAVIDLRPLREEVFYRRRFALDDLILDIFRRHDIFIIAKQDLDPTPNYKTP